MFGLVKAVQEAIKGESLNPVIKTSNKWFETDINYVNGKRNAQRVLWSNNGLVFVTYDHYGTFYEITGE